MGLSSMVLHDGWQVAIVGGNANNSLNDSAFYWNLNNGSSNRNRNIGTQLAGSFLKRWLFNSSAHAHTALPQVPSNEYEQRGSSQQ